MCDLSYILVFSVGEYVTYLCLAWVSMCDLSYILVFSVGEYV